MNIGRALFPFFNTLRRANCPNCGKQIKFGSKSCPYCNYLITLRRPTDPVERKWAIWCIVCSVVIHLIVFGLSLRRVDPHYDLPETLLWFIGSAIMSLPIIFFLVVIPSRIALNLLVKGRFRQMWIETVFLVLTFIALGWMFYMFIFVIVPNERAGQY